MTSHTVVAHEDWIAARKALLEKEKAFTKARDELSRARMDLPWERVEKDYQFQGPDGPLALADLFGDCSQLIVYNFMLGPDWEEGCPSCSLLADHYNGTIPHLKARDVSMVTVSRAPLDKIDTFKKRMGWTFPWVSSHGSDFNMDYHVSFTPQALEAGKVYYNYAETTFPADEAPGISAFRKDADGTIYHTYSAYARGLDIFITAYNLLDIAPKGRDEDELDFTMAWVRHHDRYDG